MALSMTGCGEAVASAGGTTCRVEVRCVNNRFLKVSLRAREGFSLLESQVEAILRRRVRRGAVQVSLEVSGAAAPAARRLDLVQLEAYLDQWEDFCSGHDLPVPRTIDGLLTLPGILVDQAPTRESIESLWPLVERALAGALDSLDTMRRAEGDAMARDLRTTCGEIQVCVEAVRTRVPAVVEEHRQRLRERVRKILEPQGVPLADADLAREIALLADRSDIAEELVRLDSHLEQFQRLLLDDSPGRTLDFLTQELAREANTIGSKSPDVAIAHLVVDVKTRIERLRELVQNIE